MTTTTIQAPPLENTLAEPLKDIIECKHYYALKHENWPHGLLPQIKARLETIIELIPDTQENEQLITKGNKLLRHLEANFSQSPPFSILRMAEVLYDPSKEGYKLNSIANILKYLSSLSKIILVISCVEDFPEPDFKPEAVENVQEDIPLIKIPWLEEHEILQLSTEGAADNQDKRHSDAIEQSDSKRPKPSEQERTNAAEQECSMEMETAPDSRSLHKEPDDDADKLDMSVDNDETNES